MHAKMCIHIRMHAIHIRMHAKIHIRMHAQMCIHIRMHAKMCTYTYACMRKCACENVQCMHAKMCKKCMHASLAKCAGLGKTVDKSLPNACPHACFAAYAWPAADLARPCAPFRSTQCNVPAGTACRAWRCVLKPTSSQRLTFEH